MSLRFLREAGRRENYAQYARSITLAIASFIFPR